MRTFLLIALCFAFVLAQQERTAGKRATWVPTSWGDGSAASADSTFATFKSQGVNRVYIDVWNNGKTYFNSSTMYALIGNAGIGSNQLKWGADAASKYGIELFAWFEYGLMASYGGPTSNAFAQKANSLGWVSGQADGFTWMNPSNQQVINFIGGILVDAMRAEPRLKGVQLDDHFAAPSSIAGSSVSAMTNCAQKVRGIFRASSSGLLSLAPNPLSTSISKYNVDWKAWANQGLFSEYAPQLYTASSSTFQSLLTSTLNDIPASIHPYMLAGIRCNGAGAATSWDSLSSQINYTTQKGVGVAVWYGQCINELYRSQFAALW